MAEMAAGMPGTRLVYVVDREADMVEMMRCARDLGTPANWLVRAKHNRCLPGEDGAKLWEATTSGAPLGEVIPASINVFFLQLNLVPRGRPDRHNWKKRRYFPRRD